jgi:hypothetical protein
MRRLVVVTAILALAGGFIAANHTAPTTPSAAPQERVVDGLHWMIGSTTQSADSPQAIAAAREQIIGARTGVLVQPIAFAVIRTVIGTTPTS